jgi:hypothetical protein
MGSTRLARKRSVPWALYSRHEDGLRWSESSCHWLGGGRVGRSTWSDGRGHPFVSLPSGQQSWPQRVCGGRTGYLPSDMRGKHTMTFTRKTAIPSVAALFLLVGILLGWRLRGCRDASLRVKCWWRLEAITDAMARCTIDHHATNPYVCSFEEVAAYITNGVSTPYWWRCPAGGHYTFREGHLLADGAVAGLCVSCSAHPRSRDASTFREFAPTVASDEHTGVRTKPGRRGFH